MAPGSRMHSAMLLALLCLQAALVLGAPSSRLLPPLGNTEALVTLTRNGSRTFGCSEFFEWELTASSAALVQASAPATVLGDFLNIVGDEAEVIQWSLLNSEAEQTEGGRNFTYLSGRERSVSTEEFQLYEIDARNEPILARYSFVLGHRDDGAPPARTCSAGDTAVVPFHGSFTFYTQDQVPPPVDGLLHLSVPKNELVYRSLFASGTADWAKAKAGDAWKLQSATAALEEIPGAPAAGTFTVAQDKDGGFRASWVIDEPNGWNVTAVSVGSVSLAAEDWPWQLYVNVEAGQQRPSHVQFLSTKGGVPVSSSLPNADTYSSHFSGVSWFYTSGSL